MELEKEVIVLDGDCSAVEAQLNQIVDKYAMISSYFYQVGDHAKLAAIMAKRHQGANLAIPGPTPNHRR